MPAWNKGLIDHCTKSASLEISAGLSSDWLFAVIFERKNVTHLLNSGVYFDLVNCEHSM